MFKDNYGGYGMSIDHVIKDRDGRYGGFKDGAIIMQQLKTVMRSTDGWERLTDSQKEALEMIQHKIGRVLNGDPTYVDSWTDICGFSQLIVNELEGKCWGAIGAQKIRTKKDSSQISHIGQDGVLDAKIHR